ncbi:hypothetical protein NC981_23375 [Leptolyngbya sp. DQ-M1]|uniref:hypothetical protein n=1 Tax=Leptolyngbya sp. DQ-M1 TaxID=2933920 RepID=UPI003296FB91
MNATSTRNFILVTTLMASAVSLVPVYALSLSPPQRNEVRPVQYESSQDSIIVNPPRPSRPIP